MSHLSPISGTTSQIGALELSDHLGSYADGVLEFVARGNGPSTLSDCTQVLASCPSVTDGAVGP